MFDVCFHVFFNIAGINKMKSVAEKGEMTGIEMLKCKDTDE